MPLIKFLGKHSILILVVLLLAAAFLIQEAEECKVGKLNATITTNSGNLSFVVDLADTPSKKARGLMNRSYLSQNEGMLFTFEDERILNFWMRDTLIPLDVVFIAKNMTVVDLQTMEPCRDDPCPIYSSKVPAQFALEVNAGAAKNVSIGDAVTVSARRGD